jgi:predicted dehydrogenase
VLHPNGDAVALERGDYRDFYRDLVAALRGVGAPPVALADAIAALQVMDAARESARSGRRIPL